MKTLEWFDFTSDIKRRYGKRTWIPLKISRTRKEGEFFGPDYAQTYEGVHTLLIPKSVEDADLKYGWMDNSNGDQSYAFADNYKPVDEYRHNDHEILGTKLVLSQKLFGMARSEWHLNQDVMFALRIYRDKDVWVRPEEGFVEVVRLERDETGEPEAMFIRAEFLKDYLAARLARLRISSFRDRDAAVLPDEAAKISDKFGEDQEFESGRLSSRAWETDERGDRAGSTFAVFKVGRTDIDSQDDVPIMGPLNDGNVKSESTRGSSGNSGVWRAMVEYWRDEWVEPSTSSPRVRRDKLPSSVHFIVDNDGSTMSADDLNDEDIGRWLWFKPDVVNSLLQFRGNELQWYSKFTGAITTPSGVGTHFGINPMGLVTVYARDVAWLNEWERKIWAGFNVSPEGGVSAELLKSQVEAEFNQSKAPEQFFGRVIENNDQIFFGEFGKRLFREHDKFADISSTVHRFRALQAGGLFALAKDVTRLTADRLDIDSLRTVTDAPAGDKRGSLKLLEAALAKFVKVDVAHRVMSPIFAAYELRLADAHLPKSQLNEALRYLGIAEGDSALTKGLHLLHSVVSSWSSIAMIFAGRAPADVRADKK